MNDIRQKLTDEDEGLFAYTHPSINFFDLMEEPFDFFIQTAGEVSDQQIATVNYILENTDAIESAIIPKLEKMLANFLDMKIDEIDLDEIRLGTIYVPEKGDFEYVLGFESSYDDHGFEVLMKKCEIVDQGKEFSF